MNVFLTGGTGNVGRAAIRLLADRGHRVTVIGRTPDLDIEGATYHQCDITEYEHMESLMRGHDAVVHLAAIPAPIGYPGREVFRANDLGTFNVYEAAAELGIGRIVNASSINALGFFFGDRGFPLPYLPVDEASPQLATDAYSFSKQIAEAIGEYFWQRDGISSVHLRLPAVYTHERILAMSGGTHPARDLALEILAMPDDERERRVSDLSDRYDRYRRANRLDKVPRTGGPRPDPTRRPMGHLLSETELHLMHGRANFFAYIDEIDSAESIVGGLTADYEGSHPLFVNASRNGLELPVAELAKLFWPPVTEIRPQHEGDTCLCSIDRARQLIGFNPEWIIDR